MRCITIDLSQIYLILYLQSLEKYAGNLYTCKISNHITETA